MMKTQTRRVDVNNSLRSIKECRTNDIMSNRKPRMHFELGWKTSRSPSLLYTYSVLKKLLFLLLVTAGTLQFQQIIPWLNVLLMFVAAAVPLFIFFKVKDRELRLLSGTLATFAVVHGLFHLGFIVGQRVLALSVLQPGSVILLIIFGVLLLRRG